MFRHQFRQEPAHHRFGWELIEIGVDHWFRPSTPSFCVDVPDDLAGSDLALGWPVIHLIEGDRFPGPMFPEKMRLPLSQSREPVIIVSQE